MDSLSLLDDPRETPESKNRCKAQSGQRERVRLCLTGGVFRRGDVVSTE